MTANWIPPAEFHSEHSEVPQLRTVQCMRRARVSAYIVHADRLRPLLAVLLQRMCARTAQHSMRRICAAAPSLTDEDECGSLGSPHRIPTPQTIPNRCGHPPGTTDVPRFGWMLRARWHGILDYTLSVAVEHSRIGAERWVHRACRCARCSRCTPTAPTLRPEGRRRSRSRCGPHLRRDCSHGIERTNPLTVFFTDGNRTSTCRRARASTHVSTWEYPVWVT